MSRVSRNPLFYLLMLSKDFRGHSGCLLTNCQNTFTVLDDIVTDLTADYSKNESKRLGVRYGEGLLIDSYT